VEVSSEVTVVGLFAGCRYIAVLVIHCLGTPVLFGAKSAQVNQTSCAPTDTTAE
jgi:hypothetical protein